MAPFAGIRIMPVAAIRNMTTSHFFKHFHLCGRQQNAIDMDMMVPLRQGARCKQTKRKRGDHGGH